MMYSDVTSKRLGLIIWQADDIHNKIENKISETNLKQTKINHFEIIKLGLQILHIPLKMQTPKHYTPPGSSVALLRMHNFQLQYHIFT
jgi:hypothetical protein